MRHDPLAELQTQENLLMWILAECDPVDVKITLFQIRRVRRQMTAMRREKAMAKVRLLVAVLVVLMLSGFVVSAQGDVSTGGEIVIQPEGLVYTVIGAIVGGLLTFAGLYTQFKGRNPAEDLKPEDRSGMLGILLVGGWLASKSPGEWDDKQIERLMSGYGFKSPVGNPHPPDPVSASSVMPSRGMPFKAVRREAPPIGDSIDDLAMNSWVPDEETKG